MKNKILIIFCLFFLLTISVSAENKKCVSITGDGKHIGDEIACGTEHFYVVSNDDGKIKALAKYNLEIDSTIETFNLDFSISNDDNPFEIVYNSYSTKKKLRDGYNISGLYFEYDYNSRLNNYKTAYMYKNALEEYKTFIFDNSSKRLVELLANNMPSEDFQELINDGWILISNPFYLDTINSVTFAKSDYYETKYLYIENFPSVSIRFDYDEIPSVKELVDDGWKIVSEINGGECNSNSLCSEHLVFFVKNDTYLKYDKHYQLKEHNDVYNEDGDLKYPANNVHAFPPYLEIPYDEEIMYHFDKEMFDADSNNNIGPFYEGLLMPEDPRWSPEQGKNIGTYYYLKSYIKTLKDDGYPIEKISLISAAEIYGMINKKEPPLDHNFIDNNDNCSLITNIKEEFENFDWLFTETYWTRSKSLCTSEYTYTYVNNAGDIKNAYRSYNHTTSTIINDGNAGIRPLVMLDVDNIEHSIVSNVIGKGNVSVSLTGAAVGEKITFEAKPEKGYTLGKIKVYDEEGNEIEVIDNSFIMPSSNVTIEVEFIKEAINPNTITFISLGTIIAFIISMSVMLIIKRKKNYSI